MKQFFRTAKNTPSRPVAARHTSQRVRNVQAGNNVVEAASVSISALCLVHCLALPLLLLLPGMLGLWFLSESFHIAAFAAIVPSAAVALFMGYRRHRAILPAIAAMLGIILLGVALIPDISEGAETGLTVAGSLLLMIGHGMNWRLRHRAGAMLVTG